ncbi:SMP-30/gluconolactonase/LRE family protein [Paraburkholderia youngii]|uniref:SMP-30/gluconolactonase/LRE family protein n=1 Tax=Paraburkholderia youngii TaxID=2782701 RepID=UPI003D1E4AEF
MTSYTYNAAHIADGFSFIEGPRWRDDRLYVSDMFNSRVLEIYDSGYVREVCSMSDYPSGLGFAPDGSLLVVSQSERRVKRWTGAAFEQWADLTEILPFMCNDMLVDKSGRAYVGNYGWDSDEDPTTQSTAIALIQPDGSASVAAEDLIFPNGMVLSPDGRTLYVAETYGARVSAFDVAADGSLSNRRIWASFSDKLFGTIEDAKRAGVILPDGMALDADGALWMGDAAGRAALRVAEGGKILDRVETGELTAYSVALGGPDRQTLYIGAATPLLEIQLPFRPGVTKSSVLTCGVATPGIGLP